MSLVENERTKLFANALDRASTASLTVRVLAPMAGYVYGPVRLPLLYLIIVAYIFVFLAASLHVVARWVLGRMQE